MENNDYICIRDKRVCDFYKRHSWCSIEKMNVFMVDVLEKFIQGVQPSFDDSSAMELLTEINGLKESIVQSQKSLHLDFSSKIDAMKNEYLRDVKLIVSNNTNDKIGDLLKQYNGTLEDKLRILIHELLPKTQEGIGKEISSSLRELHTNIQKETNTIVTSSLNKKTLDDFISSVDNKFAKSLVSSQTFLNTMLSSTEQRLTQKFSEENKECIQKFADVESSVKLSQNYNSNLQTSVSELLRKMENSSIKGRVSENILHRVLHALYPTAQIDFVGNTKETGDFMVYRNDKPTILFENKNHDRNVSQEEVRKFLRDAETQSCCAIMCAQHYGIANKENFQIDVHQGNVLIYLHCVEYSSDKIKIAVDIIDHFKIIMEDIKYENETIQIDKLKLDDINKEYQQFAHLKMTQCKTIKDYSHKLLSQLDDLKLPDLEHLLNKYFATTASKENICGYCQYVAKNNRALTAHQRGCSEKKRITNNNI